MSLDILYNISLVILLYCLDTSNMLCYLATDVIYYFLVTSQMIVLLLIYLLVEVYV